MSLASCMVKRRVASLWFFRVDKCWVVLKENNHFVNKLKIIFFGSLDKHPLPVGSIARKDLVKKDSASFKVFIATWSFIVELK